MENSLLPVFVFFSGGLLFISLGLGFSFLLQSRKPNPEKNQNYECGEDPVLVPARFNLRYFLAALVFVLMEVELVLMAPVLLNRKGVSGLSSAESDGILRGEMLIFLGLLISGFLLALGLRFFDWHRPQNTAPPFQGPVPDFVYEQYNLNKEKTASQGR